MKKEIIFCFIPLAIICFSCSVKKEEKTKATETKPKFALNFENVKTGKLPDVCYTAETNGRGTPGVWKVEEMEGAPSGKKVLALVETKNYGQTFNLFLTKEKFPPDLTISVKIKANKGEEDQGGGIVWRAKDPNNYYITRWNPLEKNFRVYKVQNGRRKMFKSAYLDADTSKWHEIKVIAKGKSMKIFFDGKLYLTHEDETFLQGGAVGLWTKADAASYFDDFKVYY